MDGRRGHQPRRAHDPTGSPSAELLASMATSSYADIVDLR
jgi:hypothetical protein